MSVLRLLLFIVLGLFCVITAFGAGNTSSFAQDGSVDFLVEEDFSDTSLEGDGVFPDYASDGTPSSNVDSALPDGDRVFFDSENIVPQGEMTRQGPNAVNPVTQPASRFVIVRKNHKPDEKQARLVSAERAMALGRYDSALELFDILYERNKKDARVVMGRAVVLQKLGRFDEAMNMYEQLAKLEPDDVDIKVNMLGLLSTRFPSVALRRLLDLRENNKGHVGLTAQIAVCYAALGDVESALKYLGTAASMEPRNANHMFNMAVIADRGGNKKQAISYYEQALEVDSVHGGGRTIPREVVYERLAQIR
ncbi:MAG: tetratricopeptide repeat protein [Alphaproteobacteria bacterium]